MVIAAVIVATHEAPFIVSTLICKLVVNTKEIAKL